MATRRRARAAAVLADCVALAQRLAAGQAGMPIGIGVCELVDREGRTRSAQTHRLARASTSPARSRALGPARRRERRARRGASPRRASAPAAASSELLFVIVGTGISHCLVLGGRAYAGARGNAICFGAPPVEDVASGLALAAAGGRERAEDVLADPALDGVVEAAAAALGAGLAWLVNALDPGHAS